jgi:hypothetical protein
MTVGPVALTLAATFAGAAIYISVAEHPARLKLNDRAALAEWLPSYARGAIMQGGLAMLAALLGLAAAWLDAESGGFDWRWTVGAVLIGLAWPYTLLVVAPINRRLKAMAPEAADAGSRQLLRHWGRLHLVRSGLGAAATAAYLWPLA